MSSNLDKKAGKVVRSNYHRSYAKDFILEIVKSIERGVPRSHVTREHGIARSVLSGWVRDYGSSAYHNSRQGRHSQQEKRSIIRAIEDGVMSIYDARAAYKVNSVVTIVKWIKEAKRENAELVASNTSLMANKKQDQKADPATQKALAEALKKLEEAELKVKALNTLIDVAEEQFKIAIRKKAGAKQS